MSSFLQIEELSRLLSEVLSPFESAAIINAEGQLLGVKYETITDIGTFGTCVQTAKKYFQMNEGDIVLSNDPYSGGTLLSIMTLMTPFQIGDQNFHLAIRTRFKPRLAHAQKLEDEGLRIPPTPIASNRQLNEGLVQAIASHPQAPAGLLVRFQERLQILWQQVDLMKSWATKSPNVISKTNQKAFISETHRRITEKLSEFPHGEQKLDLHFETGEFIRLHTEVQSNGIHFDFAGTSNSKRLFLTDAATYGTCMAAVLAFLGEDFLLNEGMYSLVRVTTPQDCFLNARYPAPVFEGLAEAASVLAAAAVQCLAVISSTRTSGLNCAIPTVLAFEFESPGKIYFDGLAGGAGACMDRSGIDGHFLWSLNKLQPSVEEIERQYPLRILQSGIRQGSGGKGRMLGGNGVLRELELHEACTFKWLLGHRNTQIKGLKGATGGLPSEITVIKAAGEKVSLTESRGEIRLAKGDRVIAGSAGGGGFGKTD